MRHSHLDTVAEKKRSNSEPAPRGQELGQKINISSLGLGSPHGSQGGREREEIAAQLRAS